MLYENNEVDMHTYFIANTNNTFNVIIFRKINIKLRSN